MLNGLWLILFAFIFLVLISKSVSNFLNYSRSGDNTYIKKLAVMWLVPSLFIVAVVMLSWSLSLTQVNRDRIVGSYEVDDSFYPGSNANWQKKHYRFEVHSDNTFKLYLRLADNSEAEYLGNITWANENPEKWSIAMHDPHHVVDPNPTLYREKFGFYYVFRTQKFGNMFFRKTK